VSWALLAIENRMRQDPWVIATDTLPRTDNSLDDPILRLADDSPAEQTAALAAGP
jgi:hypothetical protein